MAWLKIGPPSAPKIEFDVASPGSTTHSFLPIDSAKVWGQDGVNAVHYVPSRLIADQITALSSDEVCLVMVGVEVGPTNNFIRRFDNKDDIVAIPCPPLNKPDGTPLE